MTTVRVQALVLVFSLCLFATNAATTEPPGNQSSVTNTTENADTTTEPLSTTVATTSVITTTVTVTTQPDNKNDKTDADEDDPIKPLNEEPKKTPSPQYLLYEVEKGIRKLTLKDIEYILDIGNGKDVVSLALADKLGYLPDGDDSDPHVKIIESNQEQLVSELKHKREEFENANKHTLPPTTMPPPVTTTEEDKGRLMEYTIVKSMERLSVKEIDDLLDFPDYSIPFALGDSLGLSSNDSYLKYLEEQGGKTWRDFLLAARVRRVDYEKEHPATAPPQGDGDNDEQDPFGDEGSRYPDGYAGDYEQPHHSTDGKPPEKDNSQRHGIEGVADNKPMEGFPRQPNNQQNGDEDNNDVKPGAKEGSPDPGAEEGSPGTDAKEGSPGTGDMEDSPGTGAKEGSPDTGAGGTGESENVPYLNSGGVDDDVDISLEDDDDYLLDDTEETRSSFGAWHFLTIFIFIGVAVVVGYVCVHNRKKLREGVGTYISDANKRRRRAREYKPLMNT